MYLSLIHIFRVGNKFPAASCEETAEHLVVFQTQNMDSYDQALHTHDKQVSDHDYWPVGASPVFRVS